MREKRRVILRFLLASLAVAAAAGVAAVLLADDDFLLRIMCTGLTAAVGAVVILPLSILLDRERTARLGLQAISIVVVEFLLVLGLIWLDQAISRSLEQEFWITMWMVLLAGLVSCLFTGLMPLEGCLPASVTGLLTTAIGLLLILIAVWLPGRWYTHDEIWAAGWTVGGLGLPIGLSLVGGLSAVRWWRLVGVVAGVVGIVMLLNDIWDGVSIDEEYILIPVGLAILSAYANVLCLARLQPGQQWLRIACIAAASAVTLLADVLVFDAPGAEMLGRLTGAFAILTACGTLALVVLIAINRRGQIDEDVLEVRLSGTCPRCRGPLHLPVGKSMCERCGLRFALRMEDPRCAQCGYLLFGMESDRCPECGAAVCSS